MRFALVALIVLLASSVSAADKLPRVPPGFTIEKVTTSKLVKFPMMAGFDDRGRLFVACSSGKNDRAADLMKNPPNFIKMLEDTNGDGKFDRATVFADKMTLPMGALWYRGALYVASPPHIWRLEDTNDDGVADKRTILVDKFGFSGNAASVHGCFLGPCGRIYWCDGRHGHEFVDKKGKVTSKGKAARIFSCKPDGSDVRVHCGGGMDNPVEIDFTETGEMIGSVNILLGRPRGDCLMHWVEGGVYPRYDQQACIDEFKSTGDPLPPMTNLGHVAVSGMTRYRSDQFGKKFQNNIFTTLFNTHKVIRSELKRSGSTFTTTEHEFLTSDNPDFHPTDVLEDAEGSLLVIDTGGWFRIGCPVSKVAKPDIHGAIYRIRKTGSHNVADPRGLKLGLKKLKPEQLVKYLDDPRPAVREKVIDRLAEIGKKAIPALSTIVSRKAKRTELARRNSVWALSRIGETYRANPHHFMKPALKDVGKSVRLAAAQAIITRNLEYSGDVLIELREMAFKDTPAIRREAARALGRNLDGREFGRGTYEIAFYGIEKSLAKSGNDRVLEHSLIFALIQFNQPYKTIFLLKNKNPAVRRAALIALDQMGNGNLTRELVTPLLDTDDAALQKTALAVIAKHKGWAKETLALIRKLLNEKTTIEPGRVASGNPAMLRGFLIAQANDKDVQTLVAETLQAPKTAESKQLLLLEVMQRSSVDKFPDTWKSALGAALTSKSPAVQLQAVRTTGERNLDLDATLRKIASDENASAELRAEALIAIAPRLKRIDDGSVNFLLRELGQNEPDPLTQLTLARAVSVLPLNEPQAIRLAGTLKDVGPLAAPVLLRAFGKQTSERVGHALVGTLTGFKLAGNFSAHELSRVLKGFPSSVQQKARPLLKKLGVNPAEQQQRIAALLTSTANGDAERGRVVFYSKKAACAGCHRVAGKGGRVGPDLSAIGKIRQHRDLIEAIAFPSATLARGFASYTVVTDAGKIHTGIIARETSTEIILRDAALAEIRIPRKSIEALRESPTSIMPKGLDKTLSPVELRDLLAFLRSREAIADRKTPK